MCPVPAGFPSPAEDYVQGELDLNEYLIRNRPSSFFVRVSGDSMTRAGILCGDILLVDRSAEPGHNKIVVAVVNGEMTVKRLHCTSQRVLLKAENPDFKAIELTNCAEVRIWGVVTAVIRRFF